MHPFRTISLRPRLPEKITGLRNISRNYWFSWNAQAQNLFRRINEKLWEEVEHNPVKFLLLVKEEELEETAGNEDYINNYDRVISEFKNYFKKETWFDKLYPDFRDRTVAYFSPEFGLHESHPIYSGGLGLLAGDHMKSASDLGIPFVGVGLLYQHGYFTQIINREGKQEALYPFHNFFSRPIQPVATGQGEELLIRVAFPGRDVYAKVWRCMVGRVDLFLLDANVSLNSQEDRAITGQLYGGDRVMRISQEILLGVGGVRALRAVGISPSAWHINEGHAAFLCLERARELVKEKGLSFDTAVEAIKSDTVFTTHTPVPAGHDLFSSDLIEQYFGSMCSELNIGMENMIMPGWDEERKMFNMSLLAMNFSGYCNGVSRKHGDVSRKMFSYLYPGIPGEEIPIFHVTNGIHTSSWLAQEIKDLYTIYLGDWQDRITDRRLWNKVDDIPDNLLWAVHQSLKERVIRCVRDCLKAQRSRNQEPPHRIREAEDFLRADVLTIGFARRFATYKRAGLMFRDKDHLARLVNNPKMPVQIIFAGKAHPADLAGQELIKMIYDISNEEEFRGKIVFLENYGIDMARNLLQGVDVWLNTPRLPQEASGTSGQKAGANGVINLSVLDGWWPEGYNGSNGFAIGEDREYIDYELQDRDDSYSLFKVLEEELLPVYYKQETGFPRDWVMIMKNSIKTLTPYFSTDRMVKEYTDKFYIPSIRRGEYYSKDNHVLAEKMKNYKKFLLDNWSGMEFAAVESSATREMNVGEPINIEAVVKFGPISPEDVEVEIVYGMVSEEGLYNISTAPMLFDSFGEYGARYEGRVVLPQGTFGYTVRVRPGNPELRHSFELPLVCWARNFQ